MPSIGIERHRLDQVERGAPAVTNAPLARHSSHSSAARRIGDDPAAERRASRGRRRPAIASVRIATLNIASPSGVEPPDRAGIGAARRARLDLGDRPRIARILGAPVIDPQGNSAASTSIASWSGRELGGDGRDHLVDRSDRSRPRTARAPRRCPARRRATDRCASDRRSSDFRRAAWRSSRERGGERAILRRRRAAPRGALHRPRGQRRAVEREEQFGRERQQPVARPVETTAP